MTTDRKKCKGIFKIANNQFQKFFLRNWLITFLCIIIPLILAALIIHYYSSKSLLAEVDTAMERGVRNTKATLETLIEEACDTLEKEEIRSDTYSLLQTRRNAPLSYEFVEQANTLLARFYSERRGKLYYSLEAYSAINNYLFSTLYRGQSYTKIEDESLVECFAECLEAYPGQRRFAASREINYMGRHKRVLTIYQTLSAADDVKSFISISLDIEELISYLVDLEMMDQGGYLVVDNDQRVVFDTSGRLQDQFLALPKEHIGVVAETKGIWGQQMRLSWTALDYFGWKIVQVVPMEEYHNNTISQLRAMMLVVILGGIASAILSYSATSRLYRPIEAILSLIENPASPQDMQEHQSEIQYLLMRIWELFQKNDTLEAEMLNRLNTLKIVRAKALQEQMSPHFLNNVLQTINWIAMEETANEDCRTSQAIILLADILNTGNQQKYGLVTVAEEIAYTRKFVELASLRYGENVVCHYIVEPMAEKFLIPGISLQTLVENAIAHGFRKMNTLGNIYVVIRVNQRGGLYVCVEDDGIGIEAPVIEEIFRKLSQDLICAGEHLGLTNLFQRFTLIYGEECTFKIRRSEYGGACVEVDTPTIDLSWIQG